MKLRPLIGQVLVEVLPQEKTSTGGIAFPDEMPLSPEAVQAGHRHPTPPEPLTCIVRAIGPWPKAKNGLAVLPDFKKGQRVLIPKHAGIEMEKEIGRNFRMVRYDQVLAVFC